jgi:hypothetical protein
MQPWLILRADEAGTYVGEYGTPWRRMSRRMSQESENNIADGIEDFLAKGGRLVGKRTPRNESHAGGLSVDFTYDSPLAGPPVALEVTGLHNAEHMSASAEHEQLRKDLEDVARSEQLGAWESPTPLTRT